MASEESEKQEVGARETDHCDAPHSTKLWHLMKSDLVHGNFNINIFIYS
jgi:hypothetical protein